MTYHVSGLGVIERTATGIRAVSSPTCLPSQAEKNRLVALCRSQTQIRGLGAEMTAHVDDCARAGLPVCPTPGCIDQDTAALLTGCFTRTGNAELASLCASDEGKRMLALPYCKPNSKDSLPPCRDAIWKEGIAYCLKHGSSGPDGKLNALCWASMKDPVWFSALRALPECGGIKTTIVKLPTKTPPKKAAPPKKPAPSTLPPAVHEAKKSIEPEAGGAEAESAGVWGILLLVVLGGGGAYYYATRKPKGGAKGGKK